MSLSIFNRETIDTNDFFFENVLSDNSCFYRATSNCIKYNYSKLSNGIVNLTLDEQTQFSRDIQYTCYKWVEKNQNNEIRIGVDNDIEVTMEDLVQMTHNISLQTYLKNYINFSGSLVFDEDFTILSDRWGGYLEQIAISENLKQPLVIFSLQKYNTINNKIILGRFSNNKPYKNTRLRIIQIIGKQYLNNENDIITLLWRKNKLGEHYISVYPKNRKKIYEILKENLSD